MSKPKLSLVIPCYNEENTLEQIVEYVLGLKSETLDLELVIVDDCSKDKSLEKAEALKKKYPEIVVLLTGETIAENTDRFTLETARPRVWLFEIDE